MALHFSISASADVYKEHYKNREPLTLEGSIANCLRWLEYWGGRTRSLDTNIIEVTFPLFRRPLFGLRWRPVQTQRFTGVRRAVITWSEYGFKIQLTAQAETDVLVPLAAVLVGFVVTREIAWYPRFVGPAVSLAIVGLYWLSAWSTLRLGLGELARKVRAGLLPPGA
jgi:hypothetical protein